MARLNMTLMPAFYNGMGGNQRAASLKMRTSSASVCTSTARRLVASGHVIEIAADADHALPANASRELQDRSERSQWQRANFSNRIIVQQVWSGKAARRQLEGAGGCRIFSHSQQVNFSRTVWITFHWRRITSSVISSPSLASFPEPQHGQFDGAAMTTRSRAGARETATLTALALERPDR